jgi:ABC-2 type transport system ATP-binding protein
MTLPPKTKPLSRAPQTDRRVPLNGPRPTNITRRLLLAIGLLASQPLIMIDEPFDGLDLRQTREVMGVLRRLCGANRTLLVSIHQLSDAERLCGRFVLLSGGSVRGEGTLEDLRARTGGGRAGLEEVFLALT